MFSSRSHDRVPQLAVLLAIGVTAWLLLTRIAHAGVGAADPSPPGIDWTFWLALAGAALGGVSAILHIVAPRTKTLVDDRWRDDIDEVLAWWRGRAAGIVPGPSASTTAGEPPGGSGAAAMLVVLLLGIAGAGSMASCTAAQARQVTAAGAIAALDCEDGHIDAQMLADAKALAAAELQRLITGTAPADIEGLKAKLRGELAPIKSDAGRCGVAGALAAIAALVTPPDPGTATSALVAAGPDPATVRAAFGAAARELGWPPVRLPGGTVL